MVLSSQPNGGLKPTPRDESFTHPLAPPSTATAAGTEWAERTYHLLHVGGPVVLQAGRAVHPHAGTRTAFAGLNDGATQYALRLADTFAEGDDPDDGTVGPLRIEAVRPLEEIRLVCDTDDLAFDLIYRARFGGALSEPNRIEVDGKVVTDYRNLFQSGLYSGTVRAGGVDYELVDRAGFRDRGWGLRKHEASPTRGLVVACFCELPGEALYLLLYETASGRRMFTNGWLMTEDGIADTVAGVEHELEWDGTLLRNGQLQVTLASGNTRTIVLDVRGRIFLEAAGYTTDPARRTPGQERHDVTDPAVVVALDGQNDNACAFRVGDEDGHGFVETGLGIHARYRPG